MPDLLRRLHSYFAGERVSFADVPLDEDWGTPFQAALARALRAVPWGEVVSYGELSALAGPCPRRPGRGHVLRREPLLALRPLPPRRLGGRDRRLRLARRRVQAPPARARGHEVRWRSLTTSAPSWPHLPPGRGCCRLAEMSALFHSAGSVHLRGRGQVALHLDLADLGVARRAFSLLRRLGIRSEIRTYRRRAFDRATRYQLHVSGDDAALAAFVEAGVLDAKHAPLERPPKRVVGRVLLPRRLPPRRAPRRRLALRPALAPPRAPHDLARGRRVPALGRRDRRRAPRRPRPRPPRRRLREGSRRDRVGADARGASDAVLAFEERSVVAAARSEANRLANADHANLVRTSRAAQEQLEAVRRSSGTGRSSGCRTGCTRSPASVCATRSCRCGSWPRAASRRRARPRSPAAARKLQELASSRADLGAKGGGGRAGRPRVVPRERSDPSGSWREPGSPLGDPGSDCARKQDRRAGGEAPRTTSPSAFVVLLCRRRTGSEFDDGRARTRHVKTTPSTSLVRHSTFVLDETTSPREAPRNGRFAAMRGRPSTSSRNASARSTISTGRRRCSAGTSR